MKLGVAFFILHASAAAATVRKAEGDPLTTTERLEEMEPKLESVQADPNEERRLMESGGTVDAKQLSVSLEDIHLPASALRGGVGIGGNRDLEMAWCDGAQCFEPEDTPGYYALENRYGYGHCWNNLGSSSSPEQCADYCIDCHLEGNCGENNIYYDGDDIGDCGSWWRSSTSGRCYIWPPLDQKPADCIFHAVGLTLNKWRPAPVPAPGPAPGSPLASFVRSTGGDGLWESYTMDHWGIGYCYISLGGYGADDYTLDSCAAACIDCRDYSNCGNNDFAAYNLDDCGSWALRNGVCYLFPDAVETLSDCHLRQNGEFLYYVWA